MFENDLGDEEFPGKASLEVPGTPILNNDIDDLLEVGIDWPAYFKQSDSHIKSIRPKFRS